MGKLNSVVFTLLGAGALVGPAFADDAIQEIVVTAQKRAQSSQDVPISMNVFSSKALEEQRITEPMALAAQTPGLTASGTLGGSNPIFTMRGVGLNDVFSNNNATVSLYVDEMLLPFSPMLSFQLFDIDHVEVLKGPQGTLYGRNTTGGAINFITRKPTEETDGYLRADYGNYQHAEVEGAFGGRLTDTLTGRLSAFTVQQTGGWQTNELTGQTVGAKDEIALRGQLNWSPDERTHALLRLDWSTNKSDQQLAAHVGSYTAPFSFTPCAAALAGRRDEGPCVDFLGYYDPSTNPRVLANSNLYGDRSDGNLYGAGLTFSHDFDAFTLTSVTGYSYFHRVMGDDSDGGGLIELDTRFTDDIHSFTQELRVSSPKGSPLNWVGGLYFSDDTIKGDVLQALDQHIFHTRVDTNWIQSTTSYAGFGQVEWPFANRWSLIAGARFTSEDKSIAYDSTDLNPFGDSTLPRPVGGIDNSINRNNVSGKLGLNFHLTDNVLLYTSASKGFKSGGFKAAIAFNPAELQPFDPETLYAYELGVKSTLADGKLRLNGAAYYYDYRNFQAYITENREGVNVVVLSNAGNARIKGAEAEIVWAPLKGLEISAGANLDQAEIVKYNALAGTADDTGHELANSPRRTFNGTARYEFPLPGTSLHAFVLGSANYQSGQYFSISNNPQAYQAGYTLVNARVGVTAEDGRWEVSAWGRNLADKLYVSQAYDNYPGIFPSSWYYGDPRTYGVSVQYRYK